MLFFLKLKQKSQPIQFLQHNFASSSFSLIFPSQASWNSASSPEQFLKNSEKMRWGRGRSFSVCHFFQLLCCYCQYFCIFLIILDKLFLLLLLRMLFLLKLRRISINACLLAESFFNNLLSNSSNDILIFKEVIKFCSKSFISCSAFG